MKTERELKLEWLSRGKSIRLDLIGLYAERQERLSRAEYAGISYDSTPGHGSENGTNRKYGAIEDIEEEIHETERTLKLIEDEIREAIRLVQTPIYRTYLRMRFLGYKTEPQIAKETGYSIDSIDGHIRRKAIDAIKVNGK